MSRLDEKLRDLEACSLDVKCDIGLLLKQVVDELDSAHKNPDLRLASLKTFESEFRVARP